MEYKRTDIRNKLLKTIKCLYMTLALLIIIQSNECK